MEYNTLLFIQCVSNKDIRREGCNTYTFANSMAGLEQYVLTCCFIFVEILYIHLILIRKHVLTINNIF